MVIADSEAGFPWNCSSVVDKIYKTDNYYVNVTKRKTGRVIIFFSGNGLYYPNTKETFEKVIIQKNRYEWEHVAKAKVVQKYYEKIIFVRDVYKQWYVKGINPRIDTVDKIVGLLQELTKGYEVTTCGNSAGGYMAVLAGTQLNAKKIFSFSGQYSVEDELKKPVRESPLIHKYKLEKNRNCYFSLISYLKEMERDIFYFYPGKCQYDIEQHNLIKECSIFEFKFDSDSHGNTVRKECYPYILVSDSKELRQLAEYYKDNWINKQEFYKRLLPGPIKFICDIRYFMKRCIDKLILVFRILGRFIYWK